MVTVSPEVVRGAATWTATASENLEGATVPHTGPVWEVSAAIAKSIPATYELDAAGIMALLLQGCRHHIGHCTQVALFATPAGVITVTVEPVAALAGARPATARRGHSDPAVMLLRWTGTTEDGTWRAVPVRDGRGPLHRRIAASLSEARTGASRLGRYIAVAEAANPRAQLHKLWLHPSEPATAGSPVVVILDHRAGARRGLGRRGTTT